jgi:hypothetical protein
MCQQEDACIDAVPWEGDTAERYAVPAFQLNPPAYLRPYEPDARFFSYFKKDNSHY